MSLRRKVNTHQPQHRLIDNAQIRLNRRLGARSRPRTARSMETFRTRAPSGKSIPRKKMSLQALCDRSIRTGVFSARIGKRAVNRRSLEQLRPDPQRLIRRVPDAEHPLVAAHRSHAPAHLVGQRLKRQIVIGNCQRTGDRIAGALPPAVPGETTRLPPQIGALEGSDTLQTARVRGSERLE